MTPITALFFITVQVNGVTFKITQNLWIISSQIKQYLIPLSPVVVSRNQAALFVSVNVCVGETQHTIALRWLKSDIHIKFMLSLLYSSMQFIVVNISVYAIACRMSLLHLVKGYHIVTLAYTTTICRYINLFL